MRFDERRKGIFLAYFARGCDLIAAAAATGVCERTVYNHLRVDQVFKAAFQAALEEGYVWLEAEAARQRLEAQQRLRHAMDEAEARGDPLPTKQAGLEFDRTMKLLARWDRRHGRLGPRGVRRVHQQRMSFDDAMALLARRLRNLGIRIEMPPPEGRG